MIEKIDNSVEIRENIIIEANKLLKSPYYHKGRTRFGFDCLGFFNRVYNRVGIDIPDGDGNIYHPDWWRHCREERFLKTWLIYFEITDNPQKGDACLFRLYHSKVLNHCGIYSPPNFYHCKDGKINGGVQFELLHNTVWESRLGCFLKYKGF